MTNLTSDSAGAATPPEAERVLDASGLTCPLPVLRAQRVLKEMQAGEVLLLRSTDSISQDEVPLFCKQAGHKLLHREHADGIWQFWIRRKDG